MQEGDGPSLPGHRLSDGGKVPCPLCPQPEAPRGLFRRNVVSSGLLSFLSAGSAHTGHSCPSKSSSCGWAGGNGGGPTERHVSLRGTSFTLVSQTLGALNVLSESRVSVLP